MSAPSTGARGYPDRPVRVVVPLPPGGSTDFAARTIAVQLQKILGQPFVVETRAGDFGIRAMRELLGADPHTLMVGSVNINSIVPELFRHRMDFDYDAAIRPVSKLSEFPSLFVVRASVPASTVRDFLDHVKETRGKVRNGTDWIGSYPDIDGVILGKTAGVEFVHVPRSGGADGLLAALVGDEVDMVFLNVRTAGVGIRAGQIKAIAVCDASRLARFPHVPTMAEAGFPGIGTTHWQGLFAPGGSPPEVVRLLHGAVVQGLASAEAREALEKVDVRVAPSASPEQFAAEIRAERARWERVRGEIKLDAA